MPSLEGAHGLPSAAHQSLQLLQLMWVLLFESARRAELHSQCFCTASRSLSNCVYGP